MCDISDKGLYKTLTRWALGWCLNTPPTQFFFADISKMAFWHTCLNINIFRTCCANLNCKPRSSKVWSRGHVKLPHLRKRFNARHSYTDRTITLKVSASDIRNSIYKMYISEFRYPWHKARWILRPLYYKSMRDNWKAPLLYENQLKHSQTSVYR